MSFNYRGLVDRARLELATFYVQGRHSATELTALNFGAL